MNYYLFVLSFFYCLYKIVLCIIRNWNHECCIQRVTAVVISQSLGRDATQSGGIQQGEVQPPIRGLRNRMSYVQQPLLGRDRNQESKSKSRSGSRRGEKHLCNATCSLAVAQTFAAQVGGIIAACGMATVMYLREKSAQIVTTRCNHITYAVRQHWQFINLCVLW